MDDSQDKLSGEISRRQFILGVGAIGLAAWNSLIDADLSSFDPVDGKKD